MTTYLTGSPPDVQDWRSFVHQAGPAPKPPYSPTARKKPPVGGVSGDPLIKMLLGLIGPTSGPAQLSDADIQSKAAADANAIIGPLLQKEQADYLARLQAGMGAIGGYTSTFADRVGALGPQVQALFSGAGATEGAAGNAIASQQGATNNAGIKDFAKALELMGAPHRGQAVDTQQALGAQGVRVSKTLSADELQRMATEGGAQGDYYGKQPGIAALTGGQYVRDYTTSLNNGLQDSISGINAQLPGLVRQLISDYTSRNTDAATNASTRNLNVAQLIASVYGSNADRALNAKIFNVQTQQKQQALDQAYLIKLQSAKTSQDRAAADLWYKQQSAAINQQKANAATTAAGAAVTRANKPSTAKDPSSAAYAKAVALASGHKKIQRDSYGDVIPGQKIPGYGTEYVRIANYLRGLLPSVPATTIRYLTEKALNAAGYVKGATAPSGASSGGTVVAPPKVR